ncbi:hypothetical protein GCM10025868_23970 [Angustibacter aerolatus]|uniref:Adenylosuccinate lyase n=1 Tax=Angustibacter aerolatus TaxID=1162965 RepID=A0ABQ6JG05_9ACTN|nr:hypothetical protein [Angustibacter aerolatus]GMA87147.1 hypothetical protein GCM10025868_23970 [Angustibacter aerolatus]
MTATPTAPAPTSATTLADAGIALGPLDGRYRATVAPLVEHLSEAALNRERVRVEVEWLVHLTSTGAVPGARALTDDEVALLRAVPAGFGADDVAEPGRDRARDGARRQGRRVLPEAADARGLARRPHRAWCTSPAPART